MIDVWSMSAGARSSREGMKSSLFFQLGRRLLPDSSSFDAFRKGWGAGVVADGEFNVGSYSASSPRDGLR